MGQKIRINIPVGEAKYPLWVDMEEEPLFREAARMVNSRLIAYNTKYRGANLPPEAIMAMAAVDLAVKCQKQLIDANIISAETEIAGLVSDLREFAQSEEA